MSDLKVLYHNDLVGRAIAEENDQFSFIYDQHWIGRPDAFPISANLPPTRQRWPAQRAHPFFANLLPEGLARETVCQRLGISSDNDVALLNALGDDTAGAFRFVPTADQFRRTDRERQPISDAELEQWAEGAPALPSDPERRPRLSLAGAQQKVSVVQHDGGYAIAASGEPSTHILKFDSPRFPHLTANEFLTTRLGARLGLDVVESTLDDRTSPPILVVERYDRRPTDGETSRRLHQEDFCQLLGLLPTRKYEADGGPTLSGIADKIRALSSTPAADVLKLIRWTAFCALAGNADGHAKNLSILYEHRGPVLAPGYDLVCTRAFPNLNRQLAFSVGGRRNSDQLLREQWEQFAVDIGVRPRLVLNEVERLTQQAESALQEARADLEREIGTTQAEQQVARTIRKRIRAVRTHL